LRSSQRLIERHAIDSMNHIAFVGDCGQAQAEIIAKSDSCAEAGSEAREPWKMMA